MLKYSKGSLLPLTKLKAKFDGRIDIFSYRDLKNGDYMSIMSDLVFKAVMLNPKFKPYLARMLSYFIDMSEEEILRKMRILESHVHKRNIDQKTEIADLVIEIDDTVISIEANNTNETERNFDYATRLSAMDVQIRNKLYKYKDVVQLNINNYYFDEKKKTHEYYENKNEYGELYNCMRFYQLYLPKIKKKYYNVGKKKELLEEWEWYMLSLFESDREVVGELIEGNEFMEKYVSGVEKILIGEDLKEAYDHRLSELQAYGEETREQGLEQGLEQGREEGAKKKSAEIARELFNEGLSLEKIVKITGLTMQAIKNIVL